jgi:hypothetical protein
MSSIKRISKLVATYRAQRKVKNTFFWIYVHFVICISKLCFGIHFYIPSRRNG